MHIQAPIDRCFLLSTNIELVAETLEMKPIDGKKSGLIELGDKVLWAGWKFLLPHMHESEITEYERPDFFQDTMTRGRFRFFQHDHTFDEIGGHTLLHEKVRFALPLGFLGTLISQYVLVPYISTLMRKRLFLVKRLAESNGWKKYIPQ
jgi:hypothetical protein